MKPIVRYVYVAILLSLSSTERQAVPLEVEPVSDDDFFFVLQEINKVIVAAQ
jgi:hypothetical protein